jgi:hypothetical protein
MLDHGVLGDKNSNRCIKTDDFRKGSAESLEILDSGRSQVSFLAHYGKMNNRLAVCPGRVGDFQNTLIQGQKLKDLGRFSEIW